MEGVATAASSLMKFAQNGYPAQGTHLYCSFLSMNKCSVCTKFDDFSNSPFYEHGMEVFILSFFDFAFLFWKYVEFLTKL